MPLFKKLSKNSNDPKVSVDTQVDTDVSTSSVKESGTGQLEKLKNKNGTVRIDNSRNTTVSINILFDGKNDEEKRQIAREIFEEFNNRGARIVSAKSVDEIAGYNDYAQKSGDEDLVEFFRNKISSFDLQILKTGFYIRHLTNCREFEKAKQIRANAVRANSRAQNIINLVTEGYFESYIKPIFEESDDTAALEHYDEVVTYLPEMVFVHNEMTVFDIVEKVESKIAQRARYHAVEVKRIMVNGIGLQCVQNIMEAQVELSRRHPEYNYSFNDPHMGTMRRGRLEIILDS